MISLRIAEPFSVYLTGSQDSPLVIAVEKCIPKVGSPTMWERAAPLCGSSQHYHPCTGPQTFLLWKLTSYFAATEAQRGHVSLSWSHRTAMLQCAGKIIGRGLCLASGLWFSICAVFSRVLSVLWNCRQLSNNLQVGFSPKRQTSD